LTSAAGACAQQQTSRTPLLLSIDGTDGRTEGHPAVTQTLIRMICGSVNLFKHANLKNIPNSPKYQPGARFTKYLTTILRLSYDNAKKSLDIL